jgi:hypothetical protein
MFVCFVLCVSVPEAFDLLDDWWKEASNSISLDQPAFRTITKDTKWSKNVLHIPHGSNTWLLVDTHKPFKPTFFANHITGHFPEDRISFLESYIKTNEIKCDCTDLT